MGSDVAKIEENQPQERRGGLHFFRSCPRCGHRLPWVSRCRVCGAPGRRCKLVLIGLVLVLVATLLTR